MPFLDDAVPQIAMFRAVTDVATDLERAVTCEEVFAAHVALRTAAETAGRYLDNVAARATVARAWGLPTE